ncbi:helix-turn-helix domain-containing protein [Ornithinibacillus halophilus]|uniref:GAF domain-containing protein n=1 Tax=Ornithinibacillus halophilus TaxID=930117 RepID=A0A1M5GST3_9BACI|nr:helix-turn-helix domain-containing protein [Ornithinibacillus halophilus]SHG06816.1 GAF domain-containing protein [Ornithinibacillus halophilus]
MMQKIIEINKMLTQSLDLEQVLRNMIVAAKDLIEVADTLIIYLHDDSTNTLYFAEGEGVDKEIMKNISFSPGESIAGKVFKDRTSKLFQTEDEIDAFMENMEEENFQNYFDGVYQRKIKSVFCVPILNKDQCYGVLVVDNFKEDGVFNTNDLQLIDWVADLSAIAIDNASVYQRLKLRNDQLSQSFMIHNQFYHLIMEGDGIEKILLLLNRMTNSTIQFTDYVHSETNVYPIQRGRETLGYFILEKPFDEYKPLDKIAIEHASMTVALELMKESALYEKELHFREEVFNQIIEGITEEELERMMRYYNWEHNRKIKCVIMERRAGFLWGTNRLTDKERFVRKVEEIINGITGSPAFVLTRMRQLIVIIPNGTEEEFQYLIDRIQTSLAHVKGLVVGIGRDTSPYNLSLSYQEAKRSIDYAKSNPNRSVVEYQKLGLERILYEVDPSIANRYIEDKLNKLLVLDTNMVDTLKQYIELNKSHKETAQALHIHPNTLYYRLRKVEEVLMIDLNNEKDWLDLVIAIQLYVASYKN